MRSYYLPLPISRNRDPFHTNSTPGEDIDFLMNSNFDFEDNEVIRFNRHLYLMVKKHLFIAAVSGSVEVNANLLLHNRDTHCYSVHCLLYSV